MANIKLLQEAIQAFASGETKTADAKVRKFFIEQAQEINKKMEEELSEDIQLGQEEDFVDDIAYDDGKGSDGWVPYDDPINEAPADETEEVETAVQDDAAVIDDAIDEVEAGSDDEIKVQIKDAFEELEALFAELGADISDEPEFGSEGSDEVQGEDDFSEVSFGDESFKESVAAGRMKKVVEPNETAALSKSPVLGQPDAFVKGVEPVQIKDGSVDIKTTEDPVQPQVNVENNDNVMDNAKGLMKNAPAKKTQAATSKSVLPKQK